MQEVEQESQYIIDESQEIAVGESELVGKFFKAFPALRHRNYQLYFSGQLISLIGMWLQRVAQGWLVFQLTQSPFWVGLVSALSMLPLLLLSLPAGVLADRISKKKIIFFTQSASMVLALILGILTLFHYVNPIDIAIMAFLLGMVDALDKPARQSFIIEMVGKDDLSSAIALNSGIFNSAYVIGPGVAGIVIATLGTGGAFILNGLSFIPVIIAIYFIRPITRVASTHPHPIQAIKEGVSYAFSHPTIKVLLITMTITSVFGASYTSMMPVVVQTIFHQGATMLGYFYASAGVGAILATVFVSFYSQKLHNGFYIVSSNILFAISLLLYTFSSSIPMALFFLFIIGFSLTTQLTLINTTIQHAVSDRVRGRVMSIYVLMFLGMAPIGSFQLGFLAQHFSVFFAIRLGAVVVLVMALILFYRFSKTTKLSNENASL